MEGKSSSGSSRLRRWGAVGGLVLALLSPVKGVAFVPQLLGILALVSGSTNMATALYASAVAVGATLAFIGVKSSDQSNPTLLVQLAPDAPLPTPSQSGWTASTGAAGSGGKPSAPATASQQSYYRVSGWTGATNSFISYADACTLPHLPAATSAVDYPNGSPGICNGDCCLINGNTWKNYTTGTTCPSGYTLQSGVCNKTDNNSVMKPSDGICNIVRTGDSYAYDPVDPDCLNPTSQVSINSNVVTVNGSDGSKVVVTTDTTTHKTTLDASAPTAGDTTTTSTVKTGAVNPSPANNVVVTGTVQTTKQGQGDAATNTDAQLGTVCGVSPLPPCQVDIQVSGDTSLGSQVTLLDTAATARINAIEGAGSVTNPGFGWDVGSMLPTGSCTNPSFSIPGNHGDLTVHMCEKQSDIKAILAWFVAILTALYLFNLCAGLIDKG